MAPLVISDALVIVQTILQQRADAIDRLRECDDLGRPSRISLCAIRVSSASIRAFVPASSTRNLGDSVSHLGQPAPQVPDAIADLLQHLDRRVFGLPSHRRSSSVARSPMGRDCPQTVRDASD